MDVRVFVGSRAFDPLTVASGAPVSGLAIVQFTGPLTPPDADRLRAAHGLRLEHYLPGLAYLERLEPAAAEALRLDFLVRAVVALDPVLKLAPAAAQAGDTLTATLF